MANNALKFYRKSAQPTNVAAGAIWFNTSNSTINVYTGSAWETYTGNINDATWVNNVLTITKHDGTPISLNFSDMASAAMLGKMLTATGLNTDGTFKKNATNYGGSANSIGGEISAIDLALKGVSDLVGTTSVASQISSAKSELIGASTDGKDANTIYGAKSKADDALLSANAYTDDALEALSGTVHSAADRKVQVSVTQANGKIMTVGVTLDDIASAAELENVKKTAEDAQTASEVSAAITNAISELGADKTGESTDKHVKVQVTEVNGKLDTVSVTTSDIASAATLAEVKDKVDAFFAGADISQTADQYKDTLKELQTYLTEDAAAAATMAGNIAANKTDIRTLATATVNGHAIGSVVEDKIVAQTIVLNGSEIKLDGYAKNSSSNVAIATTDTINAALGKLEAKADKALTDASNAATAGVTSLNGSTGAITIDTGTSNGTILVAGSNVPVYGLKSTAYTDLSAFATAAQGQKADSAYQKPSTGIPSSDFASAVQTSLEKADAAAPQATTYTKTEVDELLTWAEF